MLSIAGTLALLLGALVQAPPASGGVAAPPIDWVERLPKREPVAGLSGFESVSEVRFASAPDAPHELTCVYVFPARARWQLRVRGQEDWGRTIEYRCGDAYFVLAQSEGSSVEVSARSHPEQVTSKCETHELRRAAFLWPDGFDWSPDGATKRASTSCGRSIVASLGDDGRPTEFRFEPVEGRPSERLVVREWKQRQSRWWPQTLEVWMGTERVWDERVESLSTALALLDLYFVPPDRRSTAEQASAADAIRHIDAPARRELRVELPQPSDWGQAAHAWRAHSAALVERLPTGWRLAPGAYVEVGADGAPRALLLRVQGTGASPEGVKLAPATQALISTLSWPAADMPAVIQRLRKAAPPGARVQQVLVGFPSGLEAAGDVQVTALLSADR